jgi:hypothetical protein
MSQARNRCESGSKQSSLLGLFSDLEGEGDSSETSTDFQRTTERYIPEDSTLHNFNYYQLIKNFKGFTMHEI